MTRIALPVRRIHEAFDFYHWGRKFVAGIGRSRPNGPVQEVWINTGRTGEQAETLARDSAVILSIALQYGVPINVLRHAVMRDATGAASGPIGALLDLLSDDLDPPSTAGVPDGPRPDADAAEPADARGRVHAD